MSPCWKWTCPSGLTAESVLQNGKCGFGPLSFFSEVDSVRLRRRAVVSTDSGYVTDNPHRWAANMSTSTTIGANTISTSAAGLEVRD